MSQRFVAPSEAVIKGLRRRLWLERVCWLLLLGVLAAWHYGLLPRPGQKQAVMVAANGNPVVVVATRGDAERLLKEVKAASGLPPEDVTIAETMTFHVVPIAGNPPLSDTEALRELSAKLTLLTTAYAILANNETVVSVPDQQAAVKVLSQLLQRFSPPGEMAKVSFKEDVRIEKRQVPVASLQPTAEAAVNRISEAAAPKGKYEVRPGDSAWKIAHDHKVPLSRLAAANPDLNLERIREGIELTIPGELPPITVLAVQELLEPVSAAPFAPMRKVHVVYENGAEVSRRVTSRPPARPGRPPARNDETRSAESFRMGTP